MTRAPVQSGGIDSGAAAGVELRGLAAPEQASPHSLGNRAARFAWGLAWAILFRPSPRPLHAWRNFLLRLFGARIDRTARVYPRCRVWAPWNLVMGPRSCLGNDVDCYNVATIRIGECATVSQYSYLCGATHDFEDPAHPLVPMPITIGDRAWIAADVFVAPGVTIGDGAVVGARSGVFGDVPPWVVAAGTPAKPVRERRMRGAGGAGVGSESRPARGGAA